MGLMRILFFMAVALLTYTIFKRLISGPSRRREEVMDDDRLGRLVQDPNCGIYVDSKEAVRRKGPEGDLFFCGKDCANAYFSKSQTGA